MNFGENTRKFVERNPRPDESGSSFEKGVHFVDDEQTQAQPQVVRKPKQATTSGTLKKKQEIVIDQKITVKEFSEKM